MKLYGNNGLLFKLAIDGYQFPEIQNDHWDSNWLFVRGRVEHSRDSWNFRDPCLTTFDLKRLIDWFENIGRGDIGNNFIDFLEPNLSFTYNAEAEPMIIVRIAHECAPPKLEFEERLKGESFEFPLTLNNLIETAQSLRNYLEQFPGRSV